MSIGREMSPVDRSYRTLPPSPSWLGRTRRDWILAGLFTGISCLATIIWPLRGVKPRTQRGEQNMNANHDYGKRITILLGTSFWLSIAPLSFGSVTDDLRFETSDFMKSTSYRWPDRVAADTSPNGAISRVNIQWEQAHSGNWYIEEQRYGADAICAGIAQSDPAAIDRGLKGLRWGFERQQPDGSFDCPDAFHSTSFFVEAAARACLLLGASQYGNQ